MSCRKVPKEPIVPYRRTGHTLTYPYTPFQPLFDDGASIDPYLTPDSCPWEAITTEGLPLAIAPNAHYD